MELLKTLASKLGVRELDDAVIAAVEDLIALRAGAHTALSASKDTTSVLLEEAANAVSGREKLTALVKALGVEDPDAAVERVAKLIEQSNQLTSVMPELENLKAKVAAQEDAQAEADVSQVMSARNLSADMKEALLLYRKTDPEKFAETYKPVPPELLSPAVVTPSGVELSPPSTGGFQLSPDKSGVTFKPGQSQPLPIQSEIINLAAYRGRNVTERAISYIKAAQPGADKMTLEQLFPAACQLKKQPNVVDEPLQ